MSSFVASSFVMVRGTAYNRNGWNYFTGLSIGFSFFEQLHENEKSSSKQIDARKWKLSNEFGEDHFLPLKGPQN